MSEIESILQTEQRTALTALADIQSIDALDAWKKTYLGKSSLVMTTFGKWAATPKKNAPWLERRSMR